MKEDGEEAVQLRERINVEINEQVAWIISTSAVEALI